MRGFEINLRKYIYLFLLDATFVFCNLAGSILQRTGEINWDRGGEIARTLLIPWIVVTVISTFVLARLLPVVLDFLSRRLWGDVSRKTGWKLQIAVTLLLLVAWIPCELAYFPGIFDYDVLTQIRQGIISGFTKQHPLLHTLLLNNLYLIGAACFGSGTAGVALYTIIQMLLLATAIAGAIVYLYRKGIDQRVCIGLWIWFAFFPVHPIMSVSTTKDVLFSAVFLVFFILLYDLTDQGYDRKRFLFCVLCGTISALLRNNMIYALIVFVIVAVAVVVWTKWKKRGKMKYGFMVWLGISVIVLCGLTDSVMTKQLHAVPGSRLEMLGVPIQQVARVYNYKDMDEEDRRLLNICILEEGLKSYRPSLADSVKFCIAEQPFEYCFSDYVSLYHKYARRYPGTYLNAFLELTRGLWYINDTSHIYIYYDSPNYLEYGICELDGTNGLPAVKRTVLWPKAKEFYDIVAQGEKVRETPVLPLLFAPAVYCWLLVAIWIYALYKKSVGSALCLLLPVLYGGTMLFGPAVLVRYVYPFYLIVPFAGLLLLRNKA